MARAFPVEQLKLDQRNPRIPEDGEFKDQDAALEALDEAADLKELVDSIGNSGWLEFEPLIVLEGDMVVIEGNRRLAALKILRDPRLQKRLGIVPPSELHANAKPPTVDIIEVKTREEARAFIGFKHINGAQRWDSYAKARFAYGWFRQTGDMRAISKQLGDSHNTVSRLVNAYAVLKQAEDNGFRRDEIEKKRLSFSHLYTALPSPSVRTYLGIEEAPNEALRVGSVPEDKLPKLKNFMTWLYGQGKVPAEIRSQNPDLGRLVSALANPRATLAMERGETLTVAFEMVEDKAAVFARAVGRLRNASTDVSSKLSRYDGDESVKLDVDDIWDDVKLIKDHVIRVRDQKRSAAVGDFEGEN